MSASVWRSRILVAVTLALTTMSLAFGQAAPDSAAEKQFTAWLNAFNSGDRATLLYYFEKNSPELPVK